MDFFGQQRSTRRQSHLLLAGFVASLIAIGLMLHGVGRLLVLLIAPEHANDVYLPVQAFIGILWLTMLFGSFFRWLDVRAGGAMLARRFGAVQASDRSRHADEKLLLNLVAEIAIAAACAPPEVYVMRRESNINAFVLGGTDGRNALVVTQGALDRLDREELQALVAHEFGHIAQGDIPINMRLMVALGGLLALDEVGRLLVGRNPDELAHPGVLVGYLLRGLGSTGTFFAGLLRAAFSRQREFLADAAGVQYTRNPLAMASLLAKIRDGQRAVANDIRDEDEACPVDDDVDATAIHDRHAGEIAHLCFHVGRMQRWYLSLLSSHPPLQKRIDAIEPHYDVKHRKRLKAIRDREEGRDARSAARPQAPLAGNMSYGDPDAVQPVSDRIALMVSDAASALAVVFALFAGKDASRRRAYLDAIAFAYDQDLSNRVRDQIDNLSEELREDRHALLEHASGLLRERIRADNRQRLLRNLERLLVAEGRYDLQHYATVQLLRRRLDVEFPVLEQTAGDDTPNAEARRAKTFDTMGREFALLLSLMVESSGSPAAVQEKAYLDALKCYTPESLPRRSGNDTGIVRDLEAAFQTLYVQPRAIRQAFVQHCVELMQRDGIIAAAERSMVELFAASLGCSLPRDTETSSSVAHAA